MRLADRWRQDTFIQSPVARYAVGVAAVAIAVCLRLLLTPLTGTGAPFVLFFGATLVTSIVAGVGPALLSLAISLPIATGTFILSLGYPVSQALFQALLYSADGLIIVYLTMLTDVRRRRLQSANRELQSANEQRARALAWTRETIELAPDAYFLANLDAHFTDVNQAACRLLDYEHDELLAKTIFDIIPPEDAARLKAERTRLLVPGRISKAEWSLRRRDGSFVPVEVSANILRDGRWQAFVRDVSEQKRIADERERHLASEQRARQEAESMNAQLRESEERFRLTIEEAPIGMALVALDGRFVRVNQALCEITGYAADELTERTFQDITFPADVDTDVELATKLARGEIPRYQLEKRYVRKDGSVVDVMLNGSVLRGPDGGPRYYIAQVEDITQRKGAAEALRRSEAKFSGIVSIASEAIISVDKDQRITFFNEGAEKIFGYSKSDVVGANLDRLIPERFRAVHRGHFASFAAGRESARTMGERSEIFGLRKNGETFPAEASISKVSVDGTMFFSVVLRDVTRRKRVEEALRRAVTARDEVLGIVAHDLRNPLSTIMMQASLLERHAPEIERRDQAPRLVIARSAARMNRLIQDLLDVAVVEAGQLLKVERERVSTADLAREAVETEAPLASSHSVDLRLEVGQGVPDVWGDRHRLLQVFENLIGNALKFTPEGGCITVVAASRDKQVVFSVADTGPGITPESLPHVFDRFWQASARAARLGAGLGLPITKGIVEAHEGHIWVESAVGRGTTFFFTIPIAPTDRPAIGSTGGAESTRRQGVQRRVAPKAA
jgi:PAS domain S-box-containing protein